MKLISDEYRRLQASLHRDPAYGMASIMSAPLVARFVNQTGAREILDYGCGKGRLAGALVKFVHHPVDVFQYDPAIPEFSREPSPCRFVACIDVLEHIEPDCLDAVLDDLQRVTIHWGCFTVHTGPAQKHLSDGRNAHLIQESARWWLPAIMARFELEQFERSANGFWVFVSKR